jgi:hypothetical protein
MREHYIDRKIVGFEDAGIEAVMRMERHNTMAKIANQLHSHIEKETTRFKGELTRMIIDTLEREL